MARLLVVDDDADQLNTRRMVLEAAGHAVGTAQTAAAARRAFSAARPDMVIMDLRLPRSEDGLELIRDLRAQAPGVRILVLSGWTTDLAALPERGMVDACLPKPVRSRQLLKLIGQMAVWLLWLAPALEGQEFAFRVAQAGEMVAELELSSPGSDWSAAGKEAAVADVALDGVNQQQVMVYAPRTYPVFLGRLAAGEHRLKVERNARYSAAGSKLEAKGVRFREAGTDPVVANAPILYAREDTVGRFTDVPLIVYAEKLKLGGRPLLEYTIIYSNEDGGTSTRALMARWGRTTDIDYGYRAWLDAEGRVTRATIQAKDHKELEFQGRREGAHPVLIVKTDNNMVSDEGVSPIRYQIAPVLVDLSAHSREQVMDDEPFTWRVMAQELVREDKLRPYGVVDGEKIGDPRNYLYVEMKVENRETAVALVVRRRGETVWRSSDIGRLDCAISRDGWVRTTVELPPGTTAAELGEIGLACYVVPDDKGKWPQSNACKVEAVSKAFFLGRDYAPGPSVWGLGEAVTVAAGEVRVYGVRGR